MRSRPGVPQSASNNRKSVSRARRILAYACSASSVRSKTVDEISPRSLQSTTRHLGRTSETNVLTLDRFRPCAAKSTKVTPNRHESPRPDAFVGRGEVSLGAVDDHGRTQSLCERCDARCARVRTVFANCFVAVRSRSAIDSAHRRRVASSATFCAVKLVRTASCEFYSLGRARSRRARQRRKSCGRRSSSTASRCRRRQFSATTTPRGSRRQCIGWWRRAAR